MGSRAAGRRPVVAARSDSGMVSAELALAMPALVMVVLALAWMLGLGVAQGTVVHAAREGARAAARGAAMDEIRAAARRVAPGVDVAVRRSGRWTTVSASATRTPPLRFLSLLARDVTAEATTWREWA